MAEHKNQKEEDLGASWGQQQKPLVWYNLKDRYTESGCHGQAEKCPVRRSKGRITNTLEKSPRIPSAPRKIKGKF